MPGNIFDQFDAPQMPSAPDPYVVQPNPMRVRQQQEDEARKRQDQELQRQAAARAAQASSNADAAATRAAKEWTATHNPDGSLKATAKPPTVEQGKAAGFLARARAANTDYGKLGDIGPRSLPGEAFNNAFPNASNVLSGTDRQLADQAERAFVAAVLRLDSGAAIPPQEFVTQGQIYFPRPGDTPEVIAQKARARQTALDSLALQAGSLATGLPGAPTRQDGETVNYSPVIPGGLTGSVTDDRPTSPTPPVSGNSPGYAQVAAGIGDIVEGGLGGIVGPVINPLNTIIGRALGYKGYTSDFGQTARESFGLPEGDPTIAAINQAASASVGLGGLARQVARLAPGALSRALETFGSRPITDFATGAGAGAGSELARTQGYSPWAQALAAMGGGVAAGGALGLAAATRAFGRGPARPTDFDAAVVNAGQRQGIPIRRPDAVPSLRGDMATAEASTYGGPTIGRALQRDQTAVEGRLGEIGGPGTPLTQNFTLGERAQGVGRRYIERTRQQKNDKYAQAEQASQGQRIIPQNAIAEIDQNIAELTASGANTNSATIAYLRGLRDDLAKGDGFSITEFQRLRSAASKKIKGDQALTVSDADRRLSNVVDAFTADAEDQLPQAATKALREADKFYAQRQDFIGTVLRGLNGSRGLPLPPERAAERLIAMTRNRADYQKFSRFYAEATPEEKADFAATIAESLGRGRNGEFSLGALATNIGKMPQNIRSTVFGKDGAQALEDLRIIARAKSDTGSGLNNSRSGVVMARNIGGIAGRAASSSMAGGYAGGGTGAVIAPIATEIVTALAQQRNARLLLNPDFTRWLRTLPSADRPAAFDRHVKQLQVIAAKSPVIANDMGAIGGALREAISHSPLSAAAEDDPQNRRRVPPAQ